jgi:hypothetical protein
MDEEHMVLELKARREGYVSSPRRLKTAEAFCTSWDKVFDAVDHVVTF